jgi:uncharacterized protein (TIGR03437 family)
VAIREFLCLALTATFAMAGQFTTAIGTTHPAAVSAIATDSTGNTYVLGSAQLPGTPSFVNSTIGAQAHVFVTKLDPNGKVLFTDTFAGQGVDTGAAIAVDRSGNIYIAGTTTSPDFPLSHALQTQIFPAGTVNGVPAGSGFITKLSNDGSTILYSTFFGGTLGQSAITSLATDTNGNLYLTGYTQASDFPHTAGMPFGAITQSPASPGAIVASISASGGDILYSGAIPLSPPPSCTPAAGCNINNGIEWEGVGIAVDALGNAYIAGNAASTDTLPTTAGVLSPYGTGAFVAKVNAGGTGLGYLTYVGSEQRGTSENPIPLTTLYAISVDAAGNAYLAGQTADPNFPATVGSFEPDFLPNTYNGFLAKLSPSGSKMVWATYFDAPQSIAIDAAGNVWAVGGGNIPSTLPNLNGWTTGDEFLAEVNAAGSNLTYSALYPIGTVAQSVAVDPSGLVHVAGLNGFVSAIAPATVPTPRIFYFGNAAGSGATARISAAEVIAVYGPGIGPANPAVAIPADGFYPTTLAGVEVSFNGVKAPLLYVGPDQINAVVPTELSSNAAAIVAVTNGTIASPDYPVWIVANAPLAFGPVFNEDWTINSQTNPAKSGSWVAFYATGWQSNFSPLADGQVAAVAQDTCLGRCLGGAMTLPLPFANQIGLPATVLYGGAAPGMIAGVTQFNVQLGTFSDAGPGAVYFNLAVQGPSSPTASGPSVSVGLSVTP